MSESTKSLELSNMIIIEHQYPFMAFVTIANLSNRLYLAVCYDMNVS